MTLTRLLAATALAAGTVLPAVTASATECTPRGCSAACYVNRDFTGPSDIIVCYS